MNKIVFIGVLVTKSDTMANLIWKKTFGNDAYYRPVSIIYTLDSGLLVSGIRYDYQNTAYANVGQGFILRLNKNGDIMSTGIKEQIGKGYLQINCFPNPAQNFIYFHVPFVSNYQLEIFDASGKQIDVDHSYQNKERVTIESYPSGIYMYRVKIKDWHYTGKFIRE